MTGGEIKFGLNGLIMAGLISINACGNVAPATVSNQIEKNVLSAPVFGGDTRFSTLYSLNGDVVPAQEIQSETIQLLQSQLERFWRKIESNPYQDAPAETLATAARIIAANPGLFDPV